MSKAHPVGEFEQFGRGRVVARADGVDAHLFHNFKLPLQRPRVDRAAERAEVVVVADAVEKDALAVEKEAALRVELDRANAEDRLVAVI